MASKDTIEKSADIVVFSIIRESACAECGGELWKGQFLRMEGDRPLCLGCADLDHLVFLPRGDAALTRRATKYSTLRAVVVRFSRARKRYERQGILVEEPALERAERECLADADARAVARERAEARRALIDAEYVAAFSQCIGERYPNCPHTEQRAIAEHACEKHSGRVGRSAAAKQFADETVDLAARAHVRHVHTEYDELLAQAWSRGESRAAVAAQVEEILQRWTSRSGSSKHPAMS